MATPDCSAIHDAISRGHSSLDMIKSDLLDNSRPQTQKMATDALNRLDKLAAAIGKPGRVG